jgi:hypothetical protein
MEAEKHTGMTDDERDINRIPLDERIEGWRDAGRYHARQAQRLFADNEPDLVEVAAHAAYSAMAFAVALDAKHFGDLPDIDHIQD